MRKINIENKPPGKKAPRLDLCSILSAIGDSVTIQDTGFRIIYQNESSIASSGKHIGEYCYKAYENNSRVCESCQIELCFEDGKVHRIEREVKTGRGTRYIDITASPLTDDEGRVFAGIEVVRDVTGSRKLKEVSRKAADTLRSLVAASPLAIITLDLEGIITLWSPSAERIFGWREEEVKGSSFQFIMEREKGRKQIEAFLSRARRGETISGVRMKRSRKDGSSVDLNFAISPLRGETGNITAVMCLLEDITDKVRMEERVSQSERDWEDVFNQITEMITIHDTDYNIIRANRAAESILGLRSDEKSGAKCFEYYHGKECPPEKCPSCAVLKDMQPGTTEFFEPHLKKFLEITSIPRFDAGHRLTGMIHIGRDITQKKRLESIASAATLMDSIGYVFSGIRHEIGNPVNTVKLILSVLKEKLCGCSTDEIEKSLETALEQLVRVEFLLKSLRNFNMFEDVEITGISVPEYLKKFLDLAGRDFLNRGIEISADIGPEVEGVLADPRALQQVLLNIFSNAADALAGAERPRITIRAGQLETVVFITVKDNGRGIPSQELKNLFKPFYTTKPNGTGLGLVMIKKMMAKMNGAVEITSKEGSGTAVNLFLPACKS